jgi:7-carboxy-7-deazaguanine synthase
MIPAAERLRVSEVYASIQGESTFAGRPCVFVRLTGCNLRCIWCDSAFSFVGGAYRSIDDVVDEVAHHGLPLVEVTGGEPLVQKTAIPLMDKLLARGLEVLL